MTASRENETALHISFKFSDNGITMMPHLVESGNGIKPLEEAITDDNDLGAQIKSFSKAIAGVFDLVSTISRRPRIKEGGEPKENPVSLLTPVPTNPSTPLSVKPKEQPIEDATTSSPPDSVMNDVSKAEIPKLDSVTTPADSPMKQAEALARTHLLNSSYAVPAALGQFGISVPSNLSPLAGLFPAVVPSTNANAAEIMQRLQELVTIRNASAPALQTQALVNPLLSALPSANMVPNLIAQLHQSQAQSVSPAVTPQLSNILQTLQATINNEKTEKAETKRDNSASEEECRLTLFVGNITPDMSIADVRKLFSDCDITGVYFEADEVTGYRKKYAFVQFASDADARRAMKYDGTAHGSIVLKVDYSDLTPATLTKIKEKQSQLSSTSPNAIFVGNLPLEITAERVKSLFEGYGEIMGIRLIPDKATSKCKGYGFVVYRDSAAVERALKATGTVVDGRTIEVRDARPDSQRESPKHSGAEMTSQADKLLQSLQRSMKQHNGETAKSHKKEDKKITTLYVGGLASTLTPEDLKEYFGQCGPVGDIRWEMDYQTGGRRKFAFVDFETESAAQKAMDLNGNEFHGRYLKIHRAQVKNSVTDPLVIFVGNLPSTITTRRLREFFNQCGDVKDVRLVLDKKTGLPSGFGYVEYFSETSVTSALEFNGYEMDGRRLKVENATMDNKSKRESFSKGRDSRDYGSPEFRDRSRSRSRSPRRDRDRRSRERYNGRDRDRDRDYRRRD